MTMVRDGKAKKTFWRGLFAGRCRGRALPLEQADFYSLAREGDSKRVHEWGAARMLTTFSLPLILSLLSTFRAGTQGCAGVPVPRDDGL